MVGGKQANFYLHQSSLDMAKVPQAEWAVRLKLAKLILQEFGYRFCKAFSHYWRLCKLPMTTFWCATRQGGITYQLGSAIWKRWQSNLVLICIQKIFNYFKSGLDSVAVVTLNFPRYQKVSHKWTSMPFSLPLEGAAWKESRIECFWKQRHFVLLTFIQHSLGINWKTNWSIDFSTYIGSKGSIKILLSLKST